MDIKTFAKAWREGSVCLHPTDTLPGLSFHPELKTALDNFMAIKERPENKRPISLIADWALTIRYWQPLPKGWDKVLQSLWPSSLSVIWLAAATSPEALVAEDETMAFRMPLFEADKAWMRELLLELDLPFPSSSVNRSGEPAKENWTDAVSFADQASRKIFVPQWTATGGNKAPLPSTVIRLRIDGSYEILREGAVPKPQIDRALASSQR